MRLMSGNPSGTNRRTHRPRGTSRLARLWELLVAVVVAGANELKNAISSVFTDLYIIGREIARSLQPWQRKDAILPG